MTKRVNVERLAEIKEEIKGLIREAKGIIRGTHEEDRAKGYWVAHMLMAIDDEHSYLGSGGVTMQDTIEALTNDEDEEVQDEA